MNEKICRVCLKNNKDACITDSTSHIEYFIQVTGVKVFNNELWLCTWCQSALKRCIHFIKLAKNAEGTLNLNYESIIISAELKNPYNLSYTRHSDINIPPSNITEEEDTQLDKFTENIDSNSEIQESNDSELNEHTIQMNEVPISKRKKLNYEQMKFEMKYLNLEEQLNEIELKKEKNRSNLKFVCDDCGTGYLTVDLFDEHKMRHSDAAGPNKCSICKLHFKSSDVLSQHILSHKRRFRCLICDTIFNRWSHSMTHRYKCGGVPTPSPCEYCLKIFSDEHSLNVHIKGVHKKEKKYICEQCEKKFSSKQRLTVHMRSHSGVRPFSCVQCARTFTTSSNWRAHAVQHGDVTTHYCVECDAHYATRKSLMRHFLQSARHNTNNMRYSCVSCSKKFPSEQSLAKHVEVRHNATYSCTHCDKTFSSNTNLNKHIRCVHVLK